MSISYIGSTLGIVAGVPATEDVAGYGAQTHIEVGKVISIGEIGDTSEDITFDLLKTGRRTRVNGVKDVGEVSVSMETDDADAGQILLLAAADTNTTQSFAITDSDGVVKYFYGLVANLKDSERTASAYKGQTVVLRGQSGITIG